MNRWHSSGSWAIYDKFMQLRGLAEFDLEQLYDWTSQESKRFRMRIHSCMGHTVCVKWALNHLYWQYNTDSHANLAFTFCLQWKTILAFQTKLKNESLEIAKCISLHGARLVDLHLHLSRPFFLPGSRRCPTAPWWLQMSLRMTLADTHVLPETAAASKTVWLSCM